MSSPASSFFLGCLAGGFVLPALADSSSLGRKNMLLLSCLLMALASLVTAASTNILMYSALNFVCGFGRASVGTCALVLLTESVGKRRRGQVGILSFLFFTFGYLSLPAIAYLNKGSSWRSIYLWTSVPTIIYCVVFHFLVHESPRWLFFRGRKEEFVATLKRIANNSSFTLSSFFEIESIEQEPSDANVYSAIKILLEKRWASYQALVYSFGGGFWQRYGLLCIACCLLIVTTTSDNVNDIHVHGTGSGWISTGWLQIGVETVSFFSACTAIHVLLIYTMELFPTCVRNSAILMVRQTFVLAGVFSPVLAAAGWRNGILSYGVFGVTIAFCGSFVTFLPETKGWTGVFGVTIAFCGSFVTFLPETKGSRICDTMDEEEHKAMKAKASVDNGNC
ncbi:hypothetical protein RHGRI_000662 [Rhododendron griersonianum]|uniref:Major facilitator superfamily (MFS) profile domain-containing protein n=1 Tax=Rhododendron griersonianum TaxID=479676 RepID=A0AAV6LIP2_9ERIC|nr:hypothetical protein RHGRI_000662 [Rhododendron griersonianum]